MRHYWIFNIGTAEYAPPEDWLAAWRHHTQEMWFPTNKRPSGVRAGDRAIIHGSQGRGFLAVVEVISTEPEPNPTDNSQDQRRWPYRLRYKLLVAIRADSLAPSLEEVGWDNPRRLRRQAHVRTDRETYERVTAALLNAAREAIAA